MADRKIRRALISVYDKTGVVEFARALVDEFGIEIISTGGTAALLKESGIPVTLVEEITGFPEMLDGRVKTLHPKIHAAILADRDNPEHMRQLAAQGIKPIDMVVVNLYPFENTVADPNCTFEQAIEMIDIGGPCLLRAAAKNHRHVVVVCSSTLGYEHWLSAIRDAVSRNDWKDVLRTGAIGAFVDTCAYDARVAEWLSRNDHDGAPDFRFVSHWNWGRLRYGENPHQHAELLGYLGRVLDETSLVCANPDSESGISFNNYADAHAALELCKELTRAADSLCGTGFEPVAKTRGRANGPTGGRDGEFAPSPAQRSPFKKVSDERHTRRNLPHIQTPSGTNAPQSTGHRLQTGATQTTSPPAFTNTRTRTSAACAFIKHTNPCGVGVAADAIDAYRLAYSGDPNAAMGGVLACSFPIDAEFAKTVMETYDRWGKDAGAGGFFVEVWIAPAFDETATAVIRTTKAWGERVRLLAVGDMSAAPNLRELEYRSITGGMLVQARDLVGLNEAEWKVVTKRAPSESEISDLRLAWLIAKHTKSNAISICKDGMLIGNGAGQMSRVMSCRITTWLAKENRHEDKLRGAAAASDAFFPFADGPNILMDAGVTALIQPGGSKRDQVVIDACDARGAATIFTGTRHFKH